MKKLLLTAVLCSMGLSSVPAEAEIGIGADVVSRYVWRGSDFGDGASAQPPLLLLLPVLVLLPLARLAPFSRESPIAPITLK